MKMSSKKDVLLSSSYVKPLIFESTFVIIIANSLISPSNKDNSLSEISRKYRTFAGKNILAVNFSRSLIFCQAYIGYTCRSCHISLY